MNDPLRVAIIGCGNRGKQHAIGFRADRRCRVIALVDIVDEAADALNAQFGFQANQYHDYTEMLAKEKPDMVAICLWTPLHLPVVRDCAQAGVPAILCEKPMAPTWGESLQYIDIVEQSGCQLTFSHQRRFAPGNQLVRRLIREGLFGTIQRMDLYSPPHLLDCGTHTFDQAMSFNGEHPATWVMGAVDTSSTRRYFDVRAERRAIGTLQFANDVWATVQVGVAEQDMDSGVRVVGDEGFIEVSWDGHFGQAVRYQDPTWRPPSVQDVPDGPMIGVVQNAVDCLIANQEPELSYKKALRAAEIIFSFYESVRTQRRLELPLVGITDHPLVSMLAAKAHDEVIVPRGKP